MKTSRYNFFYPYDKDDEKKYIACNVLTSSLALIDEEHYKEYLDFSDKGIEISDTKFAEDLKKGRFILDKNIDELEIIRHDMYNMKFNTSEMTLTIAPTLDCNFRCTYCYEKEVINKEKMTKETADQIVKMIEQNAKFLNSLSISWYGGEPLLEIDMIEYLSDKIIRICSENNIRYEANIVTNGYCLNEENIKILQKYNISGIQVTIDGSEMLHNSRRPLYDGSPTFDTIINNLKSLKKYNHRAVLRINVDKTNQDQIFDIINILEKMELEKWVVPYLGLVRNYNGCYTDNKCMKEYDYLVVKKEFNNYITKKGFTTIEDNKNLPQRINCFCGAEKANSFIISADGELYKCWNNIGNTEYSIGNIKSGKIKNSTYLDYTMADPTQDEQCKECQYLPVCFSGCPLTRNQNKGRRCLESRPELEDILYTIVKSYTESN